MTASSSLSKTHNKGFLHSGVMSTLIVVNGLKFVNELRCPIRVTSIGRYSN